MDIYVIFAYLIAALIGALFAVVFIFYLVESGTLSFWMCTIDVYYDNIVGVKDVPEYWATLKIGDAL